MDKKPGRPPHKKPAGGAHAKHYSASRHPAAKTHPPRSEYKKPVPRSAEETADDGRDMEEGLIEGKNAVLAALKSGRQMDKLLFASGSIATVGFLVTMARGAGITVQEVDRRKLDQMSRTGAHQGIIALVAAVEYKSIDDMRALAFSRGEKPLIVLCDGITDPHNMGAIIRSAEVAGAHGVIIPKRRSAGLNPACAKAAAGALEHLPIAKCSNIAQAVQELKKKGLFIIAADMGGELMYSLDFTVPCAIIIGAEGEGLSRLALEQSDFAASIPQKGVTPSLNASNAAAVLLYEVVRQRLNV